MRAKDLFFATVCGLGLWAFQASVLPSASSKLRPTAQLETSSVHSAAQRVDSAFDELWRQQGSQPVAAARPLSVARRISLALGGTIPSLEEIRRFESWPEPERLDRWLAERFADRRYADYVAERLARAFVGIDDGPFLLYRRRRFVSWLADQLAANQPYDQIVRHLVADSGLWTDTPGTNFITVSIHPDDANKPNANQLAARVSRAFLGLRIDCAECHDHPFAAWKQNDFQGLAAFFGQTGQSLRGIRDFPGKVEIENRKTGHLETIECHVPYATELLVSQGSARSRLATWITHRANRPFARATANRAWALLFGQPLVEPIDNLSLAGPFPPALEILADDFVEHGYDLRRLLAVIANTRAFALESQDGTAGPDSPAEPAAAWSVFPLTRLRGEQIVGALLQSASLSTIDASSHILTRIAREIGQREFVERYGDAGAEEFEPRGGTIPQRLLMMNGRIVQQKTKDDLLSNAATQIAAFAPDDRAAIETAFLAVLTRRPTAAESRHFASRWNDARGDNRKQALGDLYWALLNSTEFSWNH